MNNLVVGRIELSRLELTKLSDENLMREYVLELAKEVGKLHRAMDLLRKELTAYKRRND